MTDVACDVERDLVLDWADNADVDGTSRGGNAVRCRIVVSYRSPSRSQCGDTRTAARKDGSVRVNLNSENIRLAVPNGTTHLTRPQGPGSCPRTLLCTFGDTRGR